MAFGKSKQVETPEWFKLQRYEEFSPKNNADWLLQLGFRRDLRRVMHRVFSGGETAASLNAHHLAVEFVSKAWSIIREDPIIDLRRLEQHFPEPLPYFPSLTILFERQPRNVMAVHPTTVGEHYEAELMLGPDFRSIGEVHVESIEEISGPPEFGTAPALKLNSILEMKRVLDRKLSVDREDVTAEALDLPLYAASVFLPSSLLFTVNWLLPDTLLVPQFKEALARSRVYFAAVEGEPPQLPSDPAKSWHELQLLAYLDLTAAELFPNARKRKRPEVAVLLWPDSCTAPKLSGASLKAKKTNFKTPARTLKLLGPGQLEETLEADAAALMAERSQLFMILEARAAEDLASRSKDPSPPVQMERAISPPETRKSRKKKLRPRVKRKLKPPLFAVLFRSILAMGFRRNPNVAKKLLRLPAVKEKTGLSRSTIYARIAAGTFPRPLDLGPNTRAWLLSDVDSWIDGRIAASRHLQERVSC